MDSTFPVDPLLSPEHHRGRGGLLLDRAVHFLQREGITIRADDAINIFDSNGAIKGREGGRIQLKSRSLRRMLGELPSAFNLFDLSGAKARTLAGGRGFAAANALHACCSAVAGSASALTQIDDTIAAIAAADRFDLLGIPMLSEKTPVSGSAAAAAKADRSLPNAIIDFHALYRGLTHSMKPIIARVGDANALDGIRNLLCVMAGSAYQLERKPILIVEVFPPARSTWDDATCRIICDNARLGIPVALVSQPPGESLDELIEAVATTLAGLLFHQYSFKAAPVLWGVPFAPAARNQALAGAIWDLQFAAGHELSLPILATYPNMPTVGGFAVDSAPLLALQAMFAGAGIVAWGGANSDGVLDLKRLQAHAALLPSIMNACQTASRTISGAQVYKQSPGQIGAAAECGNIIRADKMAELDAVAKRESARHESGAGEEQPHS